MQKLSQDQTTNSKHLTIRIPDDLYEWLEAEILKSGCNKSQFVRHCLESIREE